MVAGLINILFLIAIYLSFVKSIVSYVFYILYFFLIIMKENDNMQTVQSKKISKNTWVVIVIVAILVLLWLFARGVKKNNVYKAGHDTFQSMDATFTVDYPRTWEVQVGNRGAIEATFVNKDQIEVDWKYSYIHISKWVIGSTNVEEAYSEAMDKYSKLFKKMEIVAQENTKVDGQPAKMVVFNGTLGGKSMSYAIVVFVKEGITYVATAAGDVNKTKELQQQLNSMLSSWKFTGAAINTQPSQESTWAKEQSGTNVEPATKIIATGDVN